MTFDDGQSNGEIVQRKLTRSYAIYKQTGLIKSSKREKNIFRYHDVKNSVRLNKAIIEMNIHELA